MEPFLFVLPYFMTPGNHGHEAFAFLREIMLFSDPQWNDLATLLHFNGKCLRLILLWIRKQLNAPEKVQVSEKIIFNLQGDIEINILVMFCGIKSHSYSL